MVCFIDDESHSLSVSVRVTVRYSQASSVVIDAVMDSVDDDDIATEQQKSLKFKIVKLCQQ